MFDDLVLNVPLLRRRVPNLTTAARSVGLRPATVSNLCTGKIPVGRAEVRTLIALATLAGCSLDDLVLRGGVGGLIETGIKVLDLTSPLVRGGTVGCVGRQGLGQLVLIAELLYRLRAERGFTTILWLPHEPLPGADEVLPQASASGATLQEVQSLIVAARSEQDVLLAADRETVLSGELLALRSQLSEPGSRPVTVALFDMRGETTEIDEAPYGPLDTLWHFTPDLAARGLYPAVDPLSSTSILLEGAQLEAAHLTLATRTRAILRRYWGLRPLVALHGWERFPASEQQAFQRGERLEAFLSQPLFMAESHTGKPGRWVSLADTLAGARDILDGKTDTLDVDSLRGIGGLKESPVPGDSNSEGRRSSPHAGA
jgi:F-type H+-transporting ATPase subunit beta